MRKPKKPCPGGRLSSAARFLKFDQGDLEGSAQPEAEDESEDEADAYSVELWAKFESDPSERE